MIAYCNLLTVILVAVIVPRCIAKSKILRSDNDICNTILCNSPHSICAVMKNNDDNLKCLSVKDLNGDFIINLSHYHRGGISLGSAFNFEQFDACATKWLKMDFNGDIRIRWTHILAGVLYRISTTDGVYLVKFY